MERYYDAAKNAPPRSPDSVLLGGRSLSPAKLRNLVFGGRAMFDASSSKAAPLLQSYQVSRDPHLPELYRRRAARAEARKTDARSHTAVLDRTIAAYATRQATDRAVRGRRLASVLENRPELAARSWALQPEVRAYYPSTLGAGGADLCPIRRRFCINPPSGRVPNESLMMTQGATPGAAGFTWGDGTPASGPASFRGSARSRSASPTRRSGVGSPETSQYFLGGVASGSGFAWGGASPRSARPNSPGYSPSIFSSAPSVYSQMGSLRGPYRGHQSNVDL